MLTIIRYILIVSEHANLRYDGQQGEVVIQSKICKLNGIKIKQSRSKTNKAKEFVIYCQCHHESKSMIL